MDKILVIILTIMSIDVACFGKDVRVLTVDVNNISEIPSWEAKRFHRCISRLKNYIFHDRNQLLTAMGYDADDLCSFILRRLLTIIHSLLDVELYKYSDLVYSYHCLSIVLNISAWFPINSCTIY
jgi:hypothetical protein